MSDESAPAGAAHEARPAFVADGTVHPLDPRSVLCDRVWGGITTLIIGSVLVTASVIVSIAVDTSLARRLLILCAAPVLTLAIGILAWRWPAISYRHASYRVDTDGIEIRGGVWWRRVASVPRTRIQHTDVSQGPVERRFGLATLHIFTAGTEHSEVTLAGLAHGTATAIRDHLIHAPGAPGDDVV